MGRTVYTAKLCILTRIVPEKRMRASPGHSDPRMRESAKEDFTMRIRQSIAVLVGAALLAPMALAAPQCFSPFSGVYVRFEQPVTDSRTARNGRVWGALSSCDGLVVLACGRQLVPQQGRRPGSRVPRVYCRRQQLWRGGLDRHAERQTAFRSVRAFNQRTNFGNSGTWTEITCPTPPEHAVKPPAGVDPLGNAAK